LAIAAIAAGTWLERRDAMPEFYRAGDIAKPSGNGPAAPSHEPSAALPGSPDDALLRAAPASDAERWLVDAERQLRAGRLTAPPGDNAYTSLLNAWQADSGHLRVGPAVDALIAALAGKAERDFASGDPGAART